MPLTPVNTDPYTQLGRSGLLVYALGLGTMQFGWSVDEAGAFEVMDAYDEAGGNFIDTADVYSAWSSNEGGPPNPGGISEEIIGRWMKQRGNRDRMIIATKVRGAMGEAFADHRGTQRQREGLSRRWIMQACEDSLRRLDVDHIDLYQVHWIDPLVPIEETLGALTDLVRQGKVRYLGCSNFTAWRLMEALWTSDRRSLESFISIQPEFNLLDPVRSFVETELAPMCSEYGIGVVPYSPLAAGMLTGKYRRDSPLPPSVRADANAANRFSEKNWSIVDCLLEVAAAEQQTPAQAAVNWVRSKPWVSAPIIGANRPDQLRDTLGALDRPLSAESIDRLDAVSDFPRSRQSLEE
jgi:aryl-alcohol dehydrogenase-like predicted oxidoreductase